MTDYRKAEKRVTVKDWVKAFACSILLLLLLFLLLSLNAGGGSGTGFGAGFGFKGAGPGGDGDGSGVGTGDKSGIGESGRASGGEDAGEAGGGLSDNSHTGGENQNGPIFTFGANSELAEGLPPGLISQNPTNPESNGDAGGGEKNMAPETSPQFKGDRRFGGNTNNTFAIIQPNAASPPPPETGNRFVGGKGTSGKSGGKQTGRSIGGMNVKGETLGVILDTSGSMAPYLKDLREEIARNFSNAIFLEVSGCSLHTTRFKAEKFLDSSPPKDNKRRSVMDAMFELVQVYQVDSVYWFSDLQDGQRDAALQQLRSLVWGKEMPALARGAPVPSQSEVSSSAVDSVFRLYVRSTGRTPDSGLSTIILESGGSSRTKK